MENIIPLLEAFAKGIIEAENEFTKNPKRFDDLEKKVVDLSLKTAADFIAQILTEFDKIICDSSDRKSKYTIVRHDKRTMITTAGDVTYTHTLFKDRKSQKYRYLLDDMMHLPDRERFSPMAEAKALSEAEVHSYRHAAESLSIGEQTISKTAVLEKVHGIENELENLDLPNPKEKKQCKYLYIEADEDHIHRQQSGEEAGGMMGKLIYVFEGKEKVGEKVSLINPRYFGGLYSGRKNNKKLWEEVQQYIEAYYDNDVLEKVYISGDGASWIKAGKDYVDRAVLVADKFHLMKYINRAARLSNDENAAKEIIYSSIYKNRFLNIMRLLDKIERLNGGEVSAVEECRAYLRENWDAIRRAFTDKNVIGCSAEGHVSHVLSERMSSRPMAWCETGADSMCRFRCYVRNNGMDKIIDLVNYRRERVYRKQELAATGTDGIVSVTVKGGSNVSQNADIRKYFDVFNVSLKGTTARKTLAIREHIWDI